MKCLEYGFCFTDLEEKKAGDERVQSNGKSKGELGEIGNGNGKMTNKGSGTINSNCLCYRTFVMLLFIKMLKMFLFLKLSFIAI
jgi:hypothetical protein